MALSNFLSIYLPYCIELQKDGSYVVFNREYMPVGFNTTTLINYLNFPANTHFRKIDPRTAKKLAVNKDYESGRIYLYNDGCNPTSDEFHMKKYMEKLSIVAKIRIK